VRPPGHHAETVNGRLVFCIFNKSHIAARYLEQIQPQKHSIVILISSRQRHTAQLYKRQGASSTFNTPIPLLSGHGLVWGDREGEGTGYTINIPWLTDGDEDYLYAFRDVLVPVAEDVICLITLILVSAGFDNILQRSLGVCRLPSPALPPCHEFSLILPKNTAAARRFFVLEGGYDLKGLCRLGKGCYYRDGRAIRLSLRKERRGINRRLVSNDNDL